MTRATRHILRLVMRTAYTATGFFALTLSAGVAHDGLTPAGGILPLHRPYLIFAAACWALAVVLDGVTSEPGHRGKG